MAYENTQIIVDVRPDNIAIVTFSAPPLNVFNVACFEEFERTLQALEKDPAVRVVIFTGAGSKAFSAGSDIKEFHAMKDSIKFRKFSVEGRAGMYMECLPQPTIAAVEGVCLGGGLETALCCDIRIIADNSKMGMPEGKLGLYPGGGGLYRLARIAGLPKAYEMLFTGEPIEAQECKEFRLTNKVVPQGGSMAAALDMAQKMLAMPDSSLRLMKKAVRDMWQKSSADNYWPGLELVDGFYAGENPWEGIEAFLGKRAPRFS